MSEFEKYLAEQLAIEAVKSPTVTKAFAEKLVRDTKTFSKLLNIISPELLAEALAKQITYRGDWKIDWKNSKKETNQYAHIMKKASDLSAEILSEAITKDAMGIR